MAKVSWFNRTTGRPVKKLPEHECRKRGREYCFECVIQPEPVDRPPQTDPRVVYPRWWDRYMDQMLDAKDIAFLAGVPFRNGRRRQWAG